MKKLISPVVLMAFIQFSQTRSPDAEAPVSIKPAANLFIITLDGFRWQEVFNGADSVILCDEKYTPDTGTMKMLYWAETPEERRKKLMPFFWNVICKKGQIFGNRIYDNRVNSSNLYSKSYPGYNEIFTGNTDPLVSSNKKRLNPNTNVLEYLNSLPGYRNKVVVFSSWDVFPFILNEVRSGIPINSGYENLDAGSSPKAQYINAVQEKAVYNKTATRMDELTFVAAKEYIQQNQPRVLYLALGETDEFAHEGRYDLYLQQANRVDGMIAELWHWVQTTPGYAGNTTFIITTDHGRGKKPGRWVSHGEWINGSSETWVAFLGPGIPPAGEIKKSQQQYQQQIAGTIAKVLGEEFMTGNTAAYVSLIHLPE